MNKYINIKKSRDIQISPFYSRTADELGDLKILLIRLIRLWFSGEHNQRKINRALNIKYGYFRGCKINEAIDELLILIRSYNPFLSINLPNDIQISNDEKYIIQLIFPNVVSKKDELDLTKNFVSEKEREALVHLAKVVNLSLI